MPKVSILIPTYDRPGLLFRALEKIRTQSFGDYEVLLLDDGSSEETKAQYETLLESTGLGRDDRFRWIFMPPRASRVSNPSVPRNSALQASKGELVVFCDDDDYWCDDRHIEIAVQAFEKGPELDFFFADQKGVQESVEKIERWQPGLITDLEPREEARVSGAIYDVPVGVFCKHWTPHTNTSVFRRTLLDRMGGFWIYTPMEGDVDFVYRAAAHARRTSFRDAVVCIHEIPDRSKNANASTRVSQAERYMFRMAIANHLILNTGCVEVRNFAKQLDRYACLELAAELAQKDPNAAAHYAWRGVCLKPSPAAVGDFIKYWWRALAQNH